MVIYVLFDDENIGGMLYLIVICCENFVEFYYLVV